MCRMPRPNLESDLVSPAPEARTYVHSACGGTTTINGYDFLNLCDPRYPVTRVPCAHCGQTGPLADFAWADTGEQLSAYRARVRASTPALTRKWQGPLRIALLIAGPILGTVVGLALLSLLSAFLPVSGRQFQNLAMA